MGTLHLPNHGVKVYIFRRSLICLNNTKQQNKVVKKIFLRQGKKKLYGSGPRAHAFCLAHGTFFIFYFLLFPFFNPEECHCMW